MSIGVYFAPKAFTIEQYNACLDRLDAAGAGAPEGRSLHTCFGSDEAVMVFDVWDSQEAFDRFGQTLHPILSELGVDPGTPQIMPVHNVIEG